MQELMDAEDDYTQVADEPIKKVKVEVDLTNTVNYAMQQNDIPVLKGLRICNIGNEEIRNLKIRVESSPKFSLSWETHIQVLRAGQTYNLGVVDIELSHEYLSSLRERVAGQLKFEISMEDVILDEQVHKINVLAFDEWNGSDVLPEIVTAFIIPNDPFVESVLSNASNFLRDWSGDSSISGYQSKNPSRIIKIASAIYSALQGEGIRYINPPASFEETGQKVRMPERISKTRLGTCLDLSLLFAACLEQAGLNPLIIMNKGHSLVGFWVVEETYPDTFIDEHLRVLKRVELKEICVLETTLITSDNRVSFKQAVAQGRRKLEDDFLYCVDVKRSRKSESIRPLPIFLKTQDRKSPDDNLIDDESLPAKAPRVEGLVPLPGVIEDEKTKAETPASRLERWKRKLLDLTLRNRLLNFKGTKKTLKILCPDLPVLEDFLADGDKFKVFPRPKQSPAKFLRDEDVHQKRTGKDLTEEFLLQEFKEKRLYFQSARLKTFSFQEKSF